MFEAPIFAIEEDGRELARLFGNPLDGGAIPFPATYTPVLTGPTAVISTADVARLDTMESATARLRTGGRFDPGRRDANVIAELPGESDEVVLVGAHFDSVWRGPGVIDNATGVEGLRRIAERLVGRSHPRTLVFVAFAAEEYGLIGSRFYVEEANTRGELERIVGVVNLDCIAHGDRLELMVGPEELRGRAVELARTLGLAERYTMFVQGPDPGTDHYPFALEKIPAVSVLFFPYREYHLPEEDSGLVDERKLADSVELALALVESQLARPVARERLRRTANGPAGT
jgi:Iap family predicted aminopeptidase